MAHNKVSRPPSFDAITRRGDILLKPNQKIDLLFKFLTKRESTLATNVEASKHIIRPRKIRIFILMNGQYTTVTQEYNIMPSMSPIDHTFRFYEPENSHFQVALPHFIQINHPSLSVDVSNPACSAEVIKDSSRFTVAGRAGDALTVTTMTMFIYSD